MLFPWAHARPHNTLLHTQLRAVHARGLASEAQVGPRHIGLCLGFLCGP